MRQVQRRRDFLLSAAGTIASLGLCRTPSFATEAMGINYGETEGLLWMVPYVASAEHTWQGAGLQVTTLVFPSGRVSLDALFAGKLDCCITTDTPFLLAAMRGLKPRILAPYSVTSSADAIAVRADRIKTPADFKGKTVASLAGGGGHYFLTRYLGFHHLNTSDIKVINMQPNAMALALGRGDVDALAWDTPTARAAIAQGNGKVVLLDTTDAAKYFRQYSLMLASDVFVRNRPTACDAIVVALQKAIDFVHAHPDDALKVVATRAKVGPDEARESLTEFHHEIKFDARLIDDLVHQAELAIENNLAAKPSGDLPTLFRDLLYLDGARKAAPGSVEI
jgi:ABC-type nitrate/sulfonate/bicarbonate transport system substrate-binding protein